jgi:penicillin amidase
MRWSTLAGIGAAFLASASIGGIIWLKRSLPEYSGSAIVSGARQRLDIVRDAEAVPHVFAASEHDAYFGLGYAHAQDRLWQLELNRRLGSGRLAEIFGEEALDRDRLFRTLGLRVAAERNLQGLDGRSREALEAYAAGVNAFLSADPQLPPEFAVFRVEPEPWTPADSLVWLGVMAWTLSSNMYSELWHWQLSERLTPAQIAEFLPVQPGDEPLRLGVLPGLRPRGARLGHAPSLPPRGLGSNNWVVDGRRTLSAKPLLANDPHLRLTAPAIWYLAHLQAPQLDVIGATLPGVPGVILGRNEHVAWAFTNTGSDTQDLYLEKLVPGEPHSYQTPAGPRRFETRRESIAIRGAATEVLEVRLSQHGPIISDVDETAAALVPDQHVLALAWAALAPGDRSFQFVTGASSARSASELLAAARDFHSPQQSIVFADTAGETGFVAAGRVPRRRPDNDLRGLLPAPGWLERYDWAGWIRFEELPAVRNPESGVIVTANQKITDRGYPHWLTVEWAEPSRASRIRELLDATERHSVDSFSRIQRDSWTARAATLLPALLASTPPSGSSEVEARLLDRLRAWDGEMRADAIEPLVFSAWLRELARQIYADELGDLFVESWDERPVFLANVLTDSAGQSRWCDDVVSAPRESCPERIRTAFTLALAELRQRYGGEPEAWSWGEAHRALARHFPMSSVPVLSRWFEISAPSPGGVDTVNVGGYSIADEDPFVTRHAASYRAIYDLGDVENSVFLTNTGQSGHFLSPHYRDWVQRWRTGAYAPMRTARAAVEARALGTLHLVPAAQD